MVLAGQVESCWQGGEKAKYCSKGSESLSKYQTHSHRRKMMRDRPVTNVGIVFYFSISLRLRSW